MVKSWSPDRWNISFFYRISKGPIDVNMTLITDPIELGLFYKHLCDYLIIQSLIHPFPPNLQNHCLSQTVKARELKFLENVHPTPCVTYHMSCITFYISCVTCTLSHCMCHVSFFFDNVAELVTPKKVYFQVLQDKNLVFDQKSSVHTASESKGVVWTIQRDKKNTSTQYLCLI